MAEALKAEQEKKELMSSDKKSQVDQDPALKKPDKLSKSHVSGDLDNPVNNTLAEIEKEIENKELSEVVEEVMCREKYKFRLDSVFKRYFTCFDDEDIEMIKKTRYNGERKLKSELDLVRILRKLRHFSTAFRYLLTDR